VVSSALEAYFPQAPAWERDLLLNGQLREYSPGTVLQRRGDLFNRVLLVVGGVVEAVDGETGRETRFSAGTLMGELHVLTGRLASQTWRARSFVTVLEIPKVVYNVFIRKNSDIDEQLRVARGTLTLQATAIFGDAVSSVHLTRIARRAQTLEVAPGQEPQGAGDNLPPFLFLVEEGTLVLGYEGQVIETVGPGGFCGEESLFFRGGGNLTIRALTATRGLAIPAKLLLSIPIVGWKLLETYERRLAAITGALTR
jgi:CRP-like cAMP-binding protein